MIRWIWHRMSLFDTVQDNDIIEEIKGLEIGNLTPMEALNILYNLQNKIRTGGDTLRKKLQF